MAETQSENIHKTISLTDYRVWLVFFHFVDRDKVKCHARKVNSIFTFFNDSVVVEGHLVVVLQVGVLFVGHLQSAATHVEDLAQGKHQHTSNLQRQEMFDTSALTFLLTLFPSVVNTMVYLRKATRKPMGPANSFNWAIQNWAIQNWAIQNWDQMRQC